MSRGHLPCENRALCGFSGGVCCCCRCVSAIAFAAVDLCSIVVVQHQAQVITGSYSPVAVLSDQCVQYCFCLASYLVQRYVTRAELPAMPAAAVLVFRVLVRGIGVNPTHYNLLLCVVLSLLSSVCADVDNITVDRNSEISVDFM